MLKKLKIAYIDQGFCRITYKTKNNNNENIYYCLQDDGHEGVNFYRCTNEGEPEYKCKFKKPASELLELPKGESKLEQLCAEWITKN